VLGIEPKALSMHSITELHPQTSLVFISPPHFHLDWPIPSFDYVMWLYHWGTWGNTTACFPICELKNMQWSIMTRHFFSLYISVLNRNHTRKKS
jgi:hypothetical protein